jgi:hypothetical protein
MRKVTFFEPNFRVTVVRNNDPKRTLEFVEYSENERALRERLAARGYEVQSIEPYDFTEWRNRAKRVTQRVIEMVKDGRKPPFNSSVWGELKPFLFRLFGDKCGYCEVVVRDVAPGDVEHYRPKSAVFGEPLHPGYYWLAYEVSNWFPACTNCNQVSKKTQFKIAGKRAYSPTDDLSLEQPLLLNPFTNDPASHLRFRRSPQPDGVSCTIVPLTEEGKTSIETCDLNRPELQHSRGKQWNQAQVDYLVLVNLCDSYVQARRMFEATLHRREFPATCLAAVSMLEQGVMEGS